MKLLELRTDTPAGSLPLVLLATDSTIVSRRRPVFLPEISENWVLEISAAYCISRLGKTISARFAGRYFDAMTLVARVVPVDLVGDLAEAGSSCSPLATAFDGALAIGEWTAPSEAFDFALQRPFESEQVRVDRSPAEAIALLSRSFTLKTGDIIVAGNPIITFPVNINTPIEAAIDGKTVLKFNVK